MEPFPFSPARPVPATLEIAWEPVRVALTSLALLTDEAAEQPLDPWVALAAAQLTPGQRLRNRTVFERFGAALLAVEDAPDVPAFLRELGHAHPARLRELARAEPPGLDTDVAREAAPLAQDGSALRAYLVAHLQDVWDAHLAGEWARRESQLRSLTAFMQQQHAGRAGPAAELARWATQRDVPDWALARLSGARRVLLALSPHARLFVGRLGDADTAYVFATFEPAMLRQDPIQAAEVLGPLSALADETRLRVLQALAAGGEQRGQEIIAELGASQPNVSRHLKQLVGAKLVEERRAGDTNKWYRLRPAGVRAAFHRLGQFIEPDNARAALALSRARDQRRLALAAYPPELRPLLDERGRVTHFSTKRGEQKLVLDYLISRFEAGREYTEREATQLIADWIAPGQGRFGIDPVTLRRALVDENALRRTGTGSKYWRDA